MTRADDALDNEFMRLDERAPNSITEPIDLLQSAFDDFVAANLTDDSDSDGVPDLLDNCRTVSNPMQTDADGDQFGNACDGDLSNDCATNAADLGIFRTLFFGAGSAADFNEDGVVNVADLGLLRTLFFSAPGPSGLTNDCNM
ncbi:MAG: thrombospondin type 3 repeat-containing protein [Gammaproteobacteria bacterium]